MVADVALSAESVNLPDGALSLPNREFRGQEFEFRGQYEFRNSLLLPSQATGLTGLARVAETATDGYDFLPEQHPRVADHALRIAGDFGAGGIADRLAFGE